MFNRLLKTRWLINLLISLVVLILIVLQSSAFQMASQNLTSHGLTQTHAILNETKHLSSLIEDLETGVRGYVFTKQENFLFLANRSLVELGPTLNKLSKETNSHQDMQNLLNKKLKPFIEKNVALSKELIELRVTKGLKAATSRINSVGNYIVLMETKQALTEINFKAQKLLEFQTAKDTEFHDRMSLFIFIGSLLSVFALIILLIAINTILDRKIISETRRHDQNQLLQAVLNCMSEGVVAEDMNGKLILMNPSANKLVGPQAGNFSIHDPVSKKLVTEEELPLSKAVQGKSLNNMVYLLKSTKNPEGRYLEVSVRPLITYDGLQKGGVAVFRDISESKEAQDELEAFSYSVSHDLRAPLRSIMGFSQIIVEDYAQALPLEAQDALQRIMNATKKMGHVIDGLIELARLTRTELIRETVNLSAITEYIAKDLQKQNPERKINFIISDNIIVNGDSRLLTVVMTNLMNNAYKFTSKKDDTIIEFGSLEKTAGTKTYFLRDNGVGFDMRHLEKLFGPFERLHATDDFPGTGIGLATVHRVIQRHSGRIWAEAELNKGATFYFTL